jgi:hypothetical protein
MGWFFCHGLAFCLVLRIFGCKAKKIYQNGEEGGEKTPPGGKK